MAAAEAAGLPRTHDFNTGDNEGVGYFRVNQRNGWRWNTARGFLRPVRGRSNLKVETHAQAIKVLFEDGRATCLDYRRNGETKTARARREVVLSAGAIGTPHLLQLSRVGEGGLLLALGIEVVAHVPEVGKNL